MQTRIKLVSAMVNSGDCVKSISLTVEDIEWADELLANIENDNFGLGFDNIDRTLITPTFGSTKNSIMRNKAYLYVARSRCVSNVASMAFYARSAVLLQNDDYTIKHARTVSENLDQIQRRNINPEGVMVNWEKIN